MRRMFLPKAAAVPRWMWPAAAFLIVYAAFVAVAAPDGPPLAIDAAGRVVRYAIEAGAWAWAARRPDLPVAQRRTLRMLAGITVFATFILGIDVAHSAGVLPDVVPLLVVLSAIDYLVASFALLGFPRVPLRQGKTRLVVLDLALLLGPLAVLQWVVLHAAGAAADPLASLTVMYAIAQLAMMASLSIVGTVGRPFPSRRAFWWMVAALATYVPMTVLAQLHTVYGFPWAKKLEVFVYFTGVLQTLVAATLTRTDPVTATPERPALERLFGLSPLSLSAPLALGAALVVAALRGGNAVVPLAVTLVATVALLVVRLALTAFENGQLLQREEAAEENLRAQKEQTRNEERARLLADMHDGFGSQLVSARLRAERGDLGPAQVTELLTECLADLYIVVDALKAQDLKTALSDYRYRLSRRLEGLECTAHWRIDVDRARGVSGNVVLQVLRVVQEALNNALKYGRAENLWITVTAGADGALSVEVADDGVGVKEHADGAVGAPRGQGLTSMRARARALGATLTVAHRAPSGTTVALQIPPLASLA